jgi:hypothetical protein
VTDLGNETFTERIALNIGPRFIGVNERTWPWPDQLMPDVDVLLRIRNNDGEPMVDVLPGGRVILHDCYDPDIAARRFWSSIMWYAEQERKGWGESSR